MSTRRARYAAHFIQIGRLRAPYPLLSVLEAEGHFSLEPFVEEVEATTFLCGTIHLSSPAYPLVSEVPEDVELSILIELVHQSRDWILTLP